MDGRRAVGAMAGALTAGLGLTAMMVFQEEKTGKPSELTDLKRRVAGKLGVATPSASARPSTREQAIGQTGHLALSALGGVVYAAVTDDETEVLPSGIAFGLAFYAAAHWLLGPAMGLTRAEWKSDLQTVGMHSINHILFGLATAAGAKAAAGRRAAGRTKTVPRRTSGRLGFH